MRFWAAPSRDLNLIDASGVGVLLKQFGRVALGRGNVQFERRSTPLAAGWTSWCIGPPLCSSPWSCRMTERHEAQEALQARPEAEAASHAKTQFWPT